MKLNAKASYLILGGTNGFGLASADTLVRLGARHLILAGRTETVSPALQESIIRLEKNGAQVEFRTCDVTNSEALRQLIAHLTGTGTPLAGIIYAAAIYDDAPIATMTREQFRAVLAVKAGGALTLQEILGDHSLEFVIYYSSISAVLGNPGQASYAAANSVLDALAACNHPKNGISLSLAWGAIGDVGHLARQPELKAALEKRLGIPTQSSAQALVDLDSFLLSSAPGSMGAQTLIGEVDWSAPTLRIGAGISRHARFRELDVTRHGPAAESGGLKSRITNMSREEVMTLIVQLLLDQIGEVLRIAPEKLDRHRPISDVGMDSLTALELRVLVEKKFGFDLPVMTISEGITVTRLAERVCDFLLAVDAKPPVESRVADLYARHGEATVPLNGGHRNGFTLQEEASIVAS